MLAPVSTAVWALNSKAEFGFWDVFFNMLMKIQMGAEVILQILVFHSRDCKDPFYGTVDGNGDS